MEPIGLAGPKPAVLDTVLQVRVGIAGAHVFCLVLADRTHRFCSVPEIGFGCFARDVIGGLFKGLSATASAFASMRLTPLRLQRPVLERRHDLFSGTSAISALKDINRR